MNIDNLDLNFLTEDDGLGIDDGGFGRSLRSIDQYFGDRNYDDVAPFNPALAPGNPIPNAIPIDQDLIDDLFGEDIPPAEEDIMPMPVLGPVGAALLYFLYGQGMLGVPGYNP